MARSHLDEQTRKTILAAWDSLIARRQKDSGTNEQHWTDSEVDIGFLKDIDCMNALIEPFLLCPTAFVDPRLSMEEIEAELQRLLLQRESLARQHSDQGFRGFSAKPYPFVDVVVDYVDSAASLLRLVCNVVELFDFRKHTIGKELQERAKTAVHAGVDFLLSAKVDDPQGVRWQAVEKITDPEGKFANLFFTNTASLSLRRVLTIPLVRKWLSDEQTRAADQALRHVVTWVKGQYDPGTKGFWMDADKTINQVVGVSYALELVYTLFEQVPDDYRSICSEALRSALSRMLDVDKTAELQRDFFHLVPLAGVQSVAFYDDRRYIGSFLSLLVLAKSKQKEVVDDSFVKAGQILFQGVGGEWIDGPTRLWDDGRPLICYSLDAMVGLVRYSLEGDVGLISLRQGDLRIAIREALNSPELVDVLFDCLVDRVQRHSKAAMLEDLKTLSTSSGVRR